VQGGHSSQEPARVHSSREALPSSNTSFQGRQGPSGPSGLQSTSWESVDVPWACHSCDWDGCAHLTPSPLTPSHLKPSPLTLSRTTPGPLRGFELKDWRHVYYSTGGNWQSRKWGWVGTQLGDTISFPLPGSHASALHVRLALLCSYAHVGTAAVAFVRQGRPADASGDAEPPSTETLLPLQWESKSSQQCVADLGETPAPSKSDPVLYELRVRVASPQADNGTAYDNQVKVFGLYLQPRE